MSDVDHEPVWSVVWCRRPGGQRERNVSHEGLGGRLGVFLEHHVMCPGIRYGPITSADLAPYQLVAMCGAHTAYMRPRFHDDDVASSSDDDDDDNVAGDDITRHAVVGIVTQIVGNTGESRTGTICLHRDEDYLWHLVVYVVQSGSVPSLPLMDRLRAALRNQRAYPPMVLPSSLRRYTFHTNLRPQPCWMPVRDRAVRPEDAATGWCVLYPALPLHNDGDGGRWGAAIARFRLDADADDGGPVETTPAGQRAGLVVRGVRRALFTGGQINTKRWYPLLSQPRPYHDGDGSLLYEIWMLPEPFSEEVSTDPTDDYVRGTPVAVVTWYRGPVADRQSPVGQGIVVCHQAAAPYSNDRLLCLWSPRPCCEVFRASESEPNPTLELLRDMVWQMRASVFPRGQTPRFGIHEVPGPCRRCGAAPANYVCDVCSRILGGNNRGLVPEGVLPAWAVRPCRVGGPVRRPTTAAAPLAASSSATAAPPP